MHDMPSHYSYGFYTVEHISRADRPAPLVNTTSPEARHPTESHQRLRSNHPFSQIFPPSLRAKFHCPHLSRLLFSLSFSFFFFCCFFVNLYCFVSCWFRLMVSEVRMARYRWDETWISVSSMRHVPVPAAWVIAIFPARDRCINSDAMGH